MNWARRYHLRHYARTSLVLWGVFALAAALPCARTMLWIDRATGWTVFGFSPDGARAVLGTLVSSMLTFLVFVLSATLIVVQLASGQLTPRVIAFVLANPGIKTALASLTFTYTYTLAALGRVEDRVPDLQVGIAVVLNLACIVIFFQFVQGLSGGLRPGTLMLSLADSAQRVIAQVYPVAYDPSRPEQQSTGAALLRTQSRIVEFTGRSGVVMAFSPDDLVRLAEDANAVIEMVPQVGDSIYRGDHLFRVFGGKPIPDRRLTNCIAVGTERTLDQDPRFAFRVLVDIANKALSPAINDPTTAVLALDQLDNLLLNLGRRRLDAGLAYDAAGNLRLVYDTPDWPDYVTLAVTEIRQFGEGSFQVDRRLKAMLDHLIATLPEARWPALQQELSLLGNAVGRKFPDEEDRRRAGVADYQGVGGSDS